MTDITVVIASVESKLLEVARQAQTLATGLQNVAPGEKTQGPNKSVAYLLEIAEKVIDASTHCKKLMNASIKEQAEKLQEITTQVTDKDKALRASYQIGDKFRFVRDHLHTLQQQVQESVNSLQKVIQQQSGVMSAEETLIYVYLFNAQGITLQTWQKMVNPGVFYEHSVNRPIYTIKEHVESFINRKTNKVQHAYLSVIIMKNDILAAEDGQVLNDVYGNPVVKVREGSLTFSKLVTFTHNGLDYTVNEDGEFVKKI